MSKKLQLASGFVRIKKPFELVARFENGFFLKGKTIGRYRGRSFQDLSALLDIEQEEDKILVELKDRSHYKIERVCPDGFLIRWENIAMQEREDLLLFAGVGSAQWDGLWIEGYQSWSPLLLLPFGQPQPKPRFPWAKTMLDSPFHRFKGQYSSPTFLLLWKPNAAALVGFVTSERFFTRVVFDRGRYFALNHGEGCFSRTASEELVVLTGKKPFELLLSYGALLAQRYGRTDKALPHGWCSWYFYYRNISQKAIEENVKGFAELKMAEEKAVFQIDDGYQKAVGDWLSSRSTFPRGLSPLVPTIEQKGFVPGIWLAPFVTMNKNALLVRDNRGRKVIAGFNPLWKGFFYALDLTHPENEAYLKEVFTELFKMGFRYFKLDFLYGGLLEGERHSQEMTRLQSYRAVLSKIRQWTKDSYMLGCGAPLLPSLGLVDGMRVSCDVDPQWVHYASFIFGRDFTLGTRNALIHSARRFFYNQVWHNDPDCILFRDRKTKLNHHQVKSFAAFASLYGGLFFISDRIADLSSERKKWLSHFYPSLKRKPDFYEEDDQLLILGHRQPEKMLLFLFNKTEESKTFSLSLSRLMQEDRAIKLFYFSKKAEVVQKELRFCLSGSSSEVVLLQALKNQPVFLGDWSKVHFELESLKDSFYDEDMSKLFLRFLFPDSGARRLVVYASNKRLPFVYPDFRITNVNDAFFQLEGWTNREVECVLHFEA